MGEISGLKWEDIDWKNKYIRVEQALRFDYDKGNKQMTFNSLKTLNSYRSIPFMGEIEEILKSQKRKQDIIRCELGDRYRSKGVFSTLVFVTSMGSPVSRYSAEKAVKMIRDEVNREESILAAMERRKESMLGNVTPQIIRHTFATRCFEHGIDPKVVQQIMGHAHYSTTIDIYTHVMGDKIQEESRKFGNVGSDCVNKP